MTLADLIKPLVWETSHQTTTPIHVAQSVFGKYSVHGGAWKNGMFPLSSPGVIPSSWHETIEIAQAAAQAHHVAAVTACIDPDAIARIRARIAELEAGLTLAANRLHRFSVEFVPNSEPSFAYSEWADEARALLKGADK